MAFDQRSAASGKIFASIPNDSKRLNRNLIEVTHVQSLNIRGPIAASDNTANSTNAINDRRARVPTRRERAGSRVLREHAHFLRHLAWLAMD